MIMADDGCVRPDRDSAPQWRSSRGTLIIETCDACARPYYYPRGFCPFCLGTEVRWQECSGKGTIYSYSIMRRAEPYAIAYVQLEEGPRMLSNIVDSPLEDIAIGTPVSLVFKTVDGEAVPMFKLSEGDDR